MIEHKLDTANSILYVWPKSPLEKSDFAQLAKAADPFIEETGGLTGLVIEKGEPVMVVDAQNVIRYLQITPELAQLPDLDEAFKFARSLVTTS